jgi:uncharacterized protein (TIGR02118 family)
MVDKVIAVVRDGGIPHPADLQRAITLLPTDGESGADGTVKAICMWWVDDARTLELGGVSAAYLVDERAQWASTRGAVTRVSFLQAAAGLTRAQFGDHWRDVHTPLARRHHPNIVRYTQNVVIDTLTAETPPVDGIAELTFLSVEDMRARLYDSDEGRRIIGEDVRRFIDVAAGWRVLVKEGEGEAAGEGRLDGNKF